MPSIGITKKVIEIDHGSFFKRSEKHMEYRYADDKGHDPQSKNGKQVSKPKRIFGPFLFQWNNVGRIICQGACSKFQLC